MANRAADWFNQAERDLEQARAAAEGAPFEHDGPLQGEEAIRFAGAILEFVRDGMADG